MMSKTQKEVMWTGSYHYEKHTIFWSSNGFILQYLSNETFQQYSRKPKIIIVKLKANLLLNALLWIHPLTFIYN